MKKGIKKYLFYSVFIHLVLISVFLLSLLELGLLEFNGKSQSGLTHVSVYNNSLKTDSLKYSENPQKHSPAKVEKIKPLTKTAEPEISKSKNRYKITKNSSKISLEQKKENKLFQQEIGNNLNKEIKKGGNEKNEAEKILKYSAKPEYGSNIKPEYPMVARRRGYEGEVVFNVQVLDDGNVGDMRLVKTSGYTVLDNSAQSALKKWKFVPEKFNGKFVPSWVKVPILFRLSDT